MTAREQSKIGALAKEIEKVRDQRTEVNRENVVLHETISILNARIAALESESAQYREAAEKAEKECEGLRAKSKRWRAMFEHAAQLIADEIDAYGLASDEATEEIERWAALAAGKG